MSISPTAPKVNYLNNRDLLKEIHLSKNTYCSYLDPVTDHQYDIILPSVAKINQKTIAEARKNRADRLKRETGVPVDQKKIPNTDLVFRITCWEHIPMAPKKVPKALAKKKKAADILEIEELLPEDPIADLVEVSVLLDRVEGNSLLKHGSHPGLNIFLSDLHSFPSLLTSASSLESHFSALLAAFESLLEANLQQAKALGESQYLHYLSLLLVMAVSLLGYYLVLVKPLVLVLISRIEEEWRLLLFLPYEAGVQVHRLLRK